MALNCCALDAKHTLRSLHFHTPEELHAPSIRSIADHPVTIALLSV